MFPHCRNIGRAMTQKGEKPVLEARSFSSWKREQILSLYKQTELKSCRVSHVYLHLRMSLCTLPKVIDVPLMGLLRWCSVWWQGRKMLACSERKWITRQHSFSGCDRHWCILPGSVALPRNEVLLTGWISSPEKRWVIIVWVPTCLQGVDTPLKGWWRV